MEKEKEGHLIALLEPTLINMPPAQNYVHDTGAGDVKMHVILFAYKACNVSLVSSYMPFHCADVHSPTSHQINLLNRKLTISISTYTEEVHKGWIIVDIVYIGRRRGWGLQRSVHHCHSWDSF